jgi:hypothetical protein
MVIQSIGVVITITPHCGKGHSTGRYENRLGRLFRLETSPLHSLTKKKPTGRDCGRFGSTSFLLLSSRSSYVEKKTCECAVQPARIAGIPWTIGAGLAEIGFTFESFTSSCSILRCSWGWGRLVCVMARFSHSVGRRRSPHSESTIYEAWFVEILKQSMTLWGWKKKGGHNAALLWNFRSTAWE